MCDNPSRIPQNSGKGCKMSDVVATMQSMLTEIGGPLLWCDTKESWLRRVARDVGITYSAARSIFYSRGTIPSSTVTESIRAAHEKFRSYERGVARNAEGVIEQLRAQITRNEREIMECRALLDELAVRHDRAGLRVARSGGELDGDVVHEDCGLSTGRED